MYFKNVTTPSTAGYSQAIERLRRTLRDVDAVVIGAGAGLSAAAGLTYAGERFTANFADFIAKYHYRDMYAAGFFPYPSPEEYWAYWSRHIYWNRYAQEAGPVYSDLLGLVSGKEYFVITTNVDHCFQKAGYDTTRLFYTQGDYGRWQCSLPCHQETYPNREAVLRMVAEQRDMRIPSALIPRCPKCGRPMANHLRSDHTFVEDAGWHRAAKRYGAFLQQHGQGRVLFLELGVGGNTPGIIKYPFWQMTYRNSAAYYACIALKDAGAPEEIGERSICMDADAAAVIAALAKQAAS